MMTCISLSYLIQGSTGLRGDQGDAGLDGRNGKRGPKGPGGLRGELGEEGETGGLGRVGPVGAKGDDVSHNTAHVINNDMNSMKLLDTTAQYIQCISLPTLSLPFSLNICGI